MKGNTRENNKCPHCGSKLRFVAATNEVICSSFCGYYDYSRETTEATSQVDRMDYRPSGDKLPSMVGRWK